MEIETSRLLLRPLRDDDAIAMAQALNNINVSRFLLRVPHPYSIDDASAFINEQRSFHPRDKICAITFQAAPDELIGVVSYELESDGTTVLGYWLRECCWRMGIMTEAATAMLNHAFVVDQLAFLNSGYWNPISGHLLKKLGFEEIGFAKLFSQSLQKEVESSRLHLTREAWADKQKSRAT